MAIYRFRVAIEGDESTYRDLEMSSRHTFADLQQAIAQHFQFQDGQQSEFMNTDQSWYEGDTIATLNGNLSDKGPRLSEFVNDPHQRFLCNTTSFNPVGLYIELKKVLKDDPSLTLPRCTQKDGDPPVYTQPPPQHVEDTGEADIIPMSVLLGTDTSAEDADVVMGPDDDEIIEFGGIEEGEGSEVADDGAEPGELDDDLMGEDAEGDFEDEGDDSQNYGSFDSSDL